MEEQPHASIVKATERILTNVTGASIVLDGAERISEEGRRNLLLRCADVSGTLDTPLIIKKIDVEAFDGAATDSFEAKRFYADWAGAQFLSEMEFSPSISPRFFGGDRELGFIILEDLGDHQSLVDPLLADDAVAAERAVLEFTECLGTMHAASMGRASRHAALLEAIHPDANSFTPTRIDLERSVTQFREALETLTIGVSSDLNRDLSSVVDEMMNPGLFLAFVHADPCPDNLLLSDDRIRVIDFEFAHFGHALLDAAYGRMIFPTCWCCNRLPESLVSQTEARYRTLIGEVCSAALDDQPFEDALAKICGYHLVRTLARHFTAALEEDARWGISTMRPRILSRLASFIETAAAFDRLPALRAASERSLENLESRWPETERLPVYPAFR